EQPEETSSMFRSTTNFGSRPPRGAIACHGGDCRQRLPRGDFNFPLGFKIKKQLSLDKLRDLVPPCQIGRESEGKVQREQTLRFTRNSPFNFPRNFFLSEGKVHKCRNFSARLEPVSKRGGKLA